MTPGFSARPIRAAARPRCSKRRDRSGELVRSGWKPRRTILMCEWDAEEPGLIGSTAVGEANRAELQAKAVAYINTDVGVTGPNFSAAATPSLKEFMRDVTRAGGRSHHQAQRLRFLARPFGALRTKMSAARARISRTEGSGEAPLGALGAGSDFSPFLDYAGIPSVDIGFGGDYGVYHSLYDDFYWMKHFGDPTFAYHAALARILGTIALRLDEADILPFDYSAYASEIAACRSELLSRASQEAGEAAAPEAGRRGVRRNSDRSFRARPPSLRDLGSSSVDPADSAGTQSCARFRRAGIARAKAAWPGGRGSSTRSIAPGSYAGYAAEVMPGVNESLDRKDLATLRVEADSLAAALRRAAARLDTVAKPGAAKRQLHRRAQAISDPNSCGNPRMTHR